MLFDLLDPDFERLRKVLLRQGEPDRVPFVELFADREIMEALVGEPIPMLEALDRDMQEVVLRRIIRFWHETGYDYVTVDCPLVLVIDFLMSGDTADSTAVRFVRDISREPSVTVRAPLSPGST